MKAAGQIRIGISGWNYKGWRGKFYPAGMPHHRELAYAAGIFDSIEINGTFYSLKRPDTFRRWADAVPSGFIFSVKGSQYITHIRRLADIRIPLANFFASGLLRLGAKLGPILWQFPPFFRFEPKRLEAFFKLLPRDTEQAVRLARQHDKRTSYRSWMKTDAFRPIRHCVEVRHESFRVPQFVELLRAQDIALVCADAAVWPRLNDVTSDFVYCRLHGPEQLYASGYDDPALNVWARRVLAWARGRQPNEDRIMPEASLPEIPRDVYVYFDNDAKVRAPFDAQRLMTLIRRGRAQADHTAKRRLAS